MEGIGGVADGTAIADAGVGGDGGAGTGDAGAGGGAGDGAGTGGEGGAPADGGEPGDGGEPASGDESEPSGGEEGELGEVGDEGGEGDEEVLEGADGRRVDAKTRADLAALKKVNPESAKRLGDMYHRTRSIMEEVGATTISDAVHKVRQLNATIEGVGGVEGLTQLQDEVGDYRGEIQQFADGDPALLQQLHEANPESFGTAIQNGIDLLAEKNPKLFDKLIVGPIVSRLEGAGVYGALDEVVKFVQEGKGQEAYDKLAQIKQWMDNAKKISEGHKTARTQHNPERDEIERGRQELQTERQKIYNDAATSDVNKLNNSAMFKLSENLFKDLKIGREGRGTFNRELTSRIWKIMANDKAYVRAAESLAGKNDRARHVKFIAAKFSEHLPEQYRKLRNEMYPNYKQRTAAPAKGASDNKAAATGNGNKGAAPAVKATPGKVYPRSAVDIINTPDVLLITGKAYLKGTTQAVPYQQ